MVAYIFPGQGSQAVGMGETLFTEFPELTQKANDILGYSIEKLCKEGPVETLNQTDHTQPALYVVNVFSYLKKMNETGKKPNYVAGHSLGEYNALFAADVFDFETGLRLVQKRGALMNKASGGGMAAIIGLKSDDVHSLIEKNNLTTLSIANYNSYQQIVIAGVKEAIVAAEPIFMQAGARMYIPLKVSGAFHSAYMQGAQAEFAAFIEKCNFSAPTIPVIANVNAQPYLTTEVATNLINQITSPVSWVQSVEYLLGQGETQFEEIGPGKVLTGLVNRIQKGQ